MSASQRRKPIPGFSAYEAGEDGTIWRVKPAATRGKVPYLVKGGDNGHGYLRVKIYNDEGKKVGCAVHRLVLLAFCGPPRDRMICCHYDGNPKNNSISNLRWGTSRDNSDDAIRLKEVAGEKNGRAKLTINDVKQIRSVFNGKYGQIAALARQYKISHSAMWSVVRGGNWHGS